MQHDVFINTGSRSKAAQPFFAVLQADFVGGPNRLICPLFPRRGLNPTKTLLSIRFVDADWILAVELLTPVPARMLRRPVGSVALYRDEIIWALDWLFTGI